MKIKSCTMSLFKWIASWFKRSGTDAKDDAKLRAQAVDYIVCRYGRNDLPPNHPYATATMKACVARLAAAMPPDENRRRVSERIISESQADKNNNVPF